MCVTQLAVVLLCCCHNQGTGVLALEELGQLEVGWVSQVSVYPLDCSLGW